jgi:6-phospho-beta-glucosidase
VNIPELDYPPEFLAALGMVPSDYLRYFFLGREAIADQAKKAMTRAEEVMEVEKELLAFYADLSNVDKPPSLAKRGGAFYSHAALEVIEAVALDTGAELVVDVQGRGAVAELPPDGVVEVPCTVTRRGASPLPQRPLEPSIRGLIAHVKAYEELAVRAAVQKDRRAAILALAAHPLVPSVNVAVAVVDEIAAELGLS